MRPRKDLVEIFTTFLSFETHQTSGWHADPRLKRSFSKTLEQLDDSSGPTLSASALALYWYQRWQPIPTNLPRLHLFAYVQEPCYWAAYRLSQRIAHSASASLYTVFDCFNLAIAELPKVLHGFDPNRGASLATYAEMAFSNVLRDNLRQRKAADICSDWTLLRKISKKRLIEALEHQGLSTELVQYYCLAWMCFRELWIPEQGRQRSTNPPPEFWTQLAQAYNEVKPLGQPSPSPTQLEQWLQKTCKTLRTYLYPPLDSLNQPLPGSDGRDRLDLLPADEDTSLLQQIIAQEESHTRQQQQTQLNQVLNEAIATLKPDWQTALRLYYQDNQNQSQIAKQLQCSQPSVARYLIKARETLITALLTWASTELNSPPTPERIKTQSDALEEWLHLHYGQHSSPTP